MCFFVILFNIYNNIDLGGMSVNIKKWKIISIVFSLVVGTLLHFTYQWSGENAFVGLFSAVNESTWEHLKLAFFPMLFIAMVGYFLFGKETKNYIKGNAIGIIVAISFIIIFFYTYTGMIGKNFTIIDIGTFVVAVILGECIAYKMINAKKTGNQKVCVGIIGVLLICFFVFTFSPPQIALFQDPVTGTYGIENRRSV